MHTDVLIDPDATVNALIARYPVATAVFNERGIDSCCGGGETLRAAAEHAGIDIDQLIHALRGAVEAA